MREGERRLAAIMFTDMVGYTALAQSDETLALKVLERHNQLLRPVFPRYGGREIKTMGDSFLVEFDSALDATKCAVDIQRFLHDYNVSSSDEWRIKLRIGVHLGDVVHSGKDVFGDAVNVASRIEPLADPEGVCVSQQVYDQVRNKLANSFAKLEQRRLKNVQVPIDVYKMVLPWEESGSLVEKVPSSSGRLAILPLANYSPDPNDEYFADGLTEELISTVSSISQLSVISRTSVMGYKKTEKKIREIGRELNAGTVLEGSVRKSENQVRVTVQLIDVNQDKHLWVESYDRELRNIFAVQSDIARKVADALQIRILPAEAVSIDKQPTRSDEAYLFYLKGRYYWNERTKEALDKATEYFQRSISEDPKFALGYAGLADCYYILGHNLDTEPKAAMAKAKECIAKALQLDDRLAEAHTTLAAILFDTDYDMAGAETEFKRAIELKPSYATAHQWFAIRLSVLGRMGEALVEFNRALEADPLSPIINENLADFYHNTKQFDKAIERYKKTIDLFPEFRYPRVMLVGPYVAKSMFPEAMATLDDYARHGGDELDVKAVRALVYAWMGNEAESRKLLSELETRAVELMNDCLIAETHFVLRDNDVGFTWLEKAYQARNPQIKFVALDREYDHVRSDPRYLSLMSRIGLAKSFTKPAR